ncbi:uncharacterized protein ACRADG_002005 [Cochliomyia hominivorax]
MFRKGKQNSRLNSLNEIRKNSEISLKPIKRTSKPSVKQDKTSENESIYSYETEGYNELESEASQTKLKRELSRTSLLIREYVEFKAARSIQRYVRGWLQRSKYQRQRKTAILIQKEWRRFYCQRLYFRKVENMLQQQIEQHYHRSATKIQALWRGWWVRHHIHDHTRLMHLQVMAGEDLLYCVAFKLHHLLRTHQIPGVYSLRNSNALSKVEQLLASLTFKNCNQRSVQDKDRRLAELESARKLHKKSAYGTKVPFSGPDVHNLCKPKCTTLYTAKDADLRMSKILQMYEEGQREISKPKSLKKKSGISKKSLDVQPPPKPPTFCGDVVNSMRKWKIIKENNLNVDSNIFKRPQNIENFLTEIQSKLSLLKGNCYCGNEFLEDLKKENPKYLSAEEIKSNATSSLGSMAMGSGVDYCQDSEAEYTTPLTEVKERKVTITDVSKDGEE